MIIHSVKIKNFRGVHEECNFEFNEPFVLLSAQNGMGKTTVVDAIEWALTGTIGRLATAYNTRSTNDTERRKNNAGIIKNKDAAPNSKIQVDLSFSHDNENFTIRRQQKKDILNPKESTCACLSGDPQNCKKILSAVDDGQFYRHHFCDIQKSINMQAYKRDELTELFSEFISNHDGAKAVASNLELFAADVQQLIDQRTQDTENVSKRTEDIKKA